MYCSWGGKQLKGNKSQSWDRGSTLFCWWAATALLLAVGCEPALAGGLSAYLPLNLEPEMERQIERVLILADEPILKRPIPVELVKLALPQACLVDKPLCHKVERYLERYSRDYGIVHASATASEYHGADVVIPNQYGLTNDSHYDFSTQAFVQPSDYLLAQTGIVAYQGRAHPNGTELSAGFNWMQLDVGYRPHWLSPMTDSSTLISTEAPTMASATLSNYEPLTRLGFQYEFSLAKMDQTGKGSPPGDNISYQGVESRGNPKLLMAQFSIEPFPGWSFGVNRLLEYGGGSGLPDSANFLFHSFFKPAGQAQLEANQQASYVSRFIFPGKTPFAVYAQYAGEDNSDGGSYLLGNAAFSVGIDFPRIWHHFDLTYEISEWQNIWYVHNIFLDGTTQVGIVEGNWGAQERVFNDGVGARMQMLRIGWEPPFGGYLQEQFHAVQNENYYGGDSRQYYPGQPAPFVYHHYFDASVMYSHPWKATTLGGEVLYGHDVFGQTFWRLSGFVRYGGDSKSRDDGTVEDEILSRRRQPERVGGIRGRGRQRESGDRESRSRDQAIQHQLVARPAFRTRRASRRYGARRSRRARRNRRGPGSPSDRVAHGRLALPLRGEVRVGRLWRGRPLSAGHTGLLDLSGCGRRVAQLPVVAAQMGSRARLPPRAKCGPRSCTADRSPRIASRQLLQDRLGRPVSVAAFLIGSPRALTGRASPAAPRRRRLARLSVGFDGLDLPSFSDRRP